MFELSAVAKPAPLTFVRRELNEAASSCRYRVRVLCYAFSALEYRDYGLYDYRTDYRTPYTAIRHRTTLMYGNRVYIPQPTPFESRLMTKYAHTKAEGFGARLAQLRKAAGFTQTQLADELSTSRRRIAYYESESDHPPANLLADLARVLNVTTDELLGSAPVKRQAKAAMSPRLERRLKQIEHLSPKPKQQLLALIDTFIEAEALKQRGNAR